MLIDNDADLTALLIADMEGVIDAITNTLLEKLKEKIQEIVYDSYDPIWYPRQGERGLGNEWEKTDAHSEGNIVESEISENPMKLNTDSDNFIHGSNFWNLNDIRDLLAEIVIEGESGPLFGSGPWTFPRDFWTPFIELLEDGTIEKIIEKEFKLRNIKFKRLI